MSDETKKPCNCTKVIAIVALIFSIISLTLSIINFDFTGNAQGKKVVISKQYDKGQSIEKALKTEKPMLVFFYTDWCGFCQRFVPTFAKVAKNKEIKKAVAVAYVNCENPDNQSIVQEYGVNGFPTVYVVKGKDKKQLDNHTFFNEDSVETIKKDVLDYIK